VSTLSEREVALARENASLREQLRTLTRLDQELRDNQMALAQKRLAERDRARNQIAQALTSLRAVSVFVCDDRAALPYVSVGEYRSALQRGISSLIAKATGPDPIQLPEMRVSPAYDTNEVQLECFDADGQNQLSGRLSIDRAHELVTQIRDCVGELVAARDSESSPGPSLS
jgi:hypothetical protein